MPNIGYGTDKKTKFMDRDGFIRQLVQNVADLEALMMHNDKYKALIGHSVGGKKRRDIVLRAKELDIKVVNRRARLKTEEKE
jgi:large subunit ribosomal protein L32e